MCAYDSTTDELVVKSLWDSAENFALHNSSFCSARLQRKRPSQTFPAWGEDMGNDFNKALRNAL